jgi:hypothetical protein
MFYFIGYVEDLKHVLCSTSENDLDTIKKKYKRKVPEPLNSQFANKTPRDDAIIKNAARKRKVAELFPSGILFSLSKKFTCLTPCRYILC